MRYFGSILGHFGCSQLCKKNNGTLPLSSFIGTKSLVLIAWTQKMNFYGEGCRSILAMKICCYFSLHLPPYKCLKIAKEVKYGKLLKRIGFVCITYTESVFQMKNSRIFMNNLNRVLVLGVVVPGRYLVSRLWLLSCTSVLVSHSKDQSWYPRTLSSSGKPHGFSKEL